MREIKFRAWSAHHKTYADQAEVFHDGSWGFGFADGDSGVGYGFKPGEGDALEQYTGLKDKNGVEIYEGDIVKAQHPDDINTCVGEIVCDSEVSAYILDQRDFAGTPLYEFDEFEVIGNIHENPGLLK